MSANEKIRKKKLKKKPRALISHPLESKMKKRDGVVEARCLNKIKPSHNSTETAQPLNRKKTYS